jgi:hypothetical protein
LELYRPDVAQSVEQSCAALEAAVPLDAPQPESLAVRLRKSLAEHPQMELVPLAEELSDAQAVR